jgi:hypothetical protein
VNNASQKIFVPPGTLFVLVMLFQYLLNLGESICIYQWLMSSFAWDITQFHPRLTKVKAVMEYLAPFRSRYPVSQTAAVTERTSLRCPGFQCPFTGADLAESLRHKWAILGVHIDPGRVLIVFVDIAKRCLLRPAADFYLF